MTLDSPSTEDSRISSIGLEQLCRAVKSPADIRQLPGYIARIDPKLIGLKRIIWPYGFRTEIQCALTNCGVYHKWGVLIELEDGSVSNIGHVCGSDADKFSTKFTVEMKKMSDARLRAEMLPVLLDRGKLQTIERQARTAYEEGRKWLARRKSFTELYPDVSREIAKRHAGGARVAITEVIERTEEQIDNAVSSGQFRNRESARYKEEQKGVVYGTSIFDLEERAVLALWRRADILLDADPQSADTSVLHELFNEVNSLPIHASAILSHCDSAQAFFSAANLSLLSHLPMPQQAKESIAQLTLEKIDAHTAANSDPGQVGEQALKKPLNKKQRDHYRRAGLKPPE